MENLYFPELAKIIYIEELSPMVKLFRLKKINGNFKRNKDGLVFIPGQFFLIGKFGYGEAPFGGASDPLQNNYIEVIIRKTGTLTSQLHNLKIDEIITIRGPLGNGYPLKFIEGKDLVLISGGCGIPPIAALIKYIIRNRSKFNKVYLLYGAATPNDLLLKDRFIKWKQFINVLLTVDKADGDWKGNVGWVSDLVKDIQIEPLNTIALMCGPGPMITALEKVLRPLGISDRRIFVADERKMQCGLGKCQHCVTGDKYVCLDGPVFYLDQIDKNID